MAPTAVTETSAHVDIADLKAKMVGDRIEVVEDHKPPVADNFMYDFKYNHALPTIDVLGQDIPAVVDPKYEAEELTRLLEQALSSGDAEAFTDLFLDYGKLNVVGAVYSLTDRCLEGQAFLHLGL
jgi:hypothetical protein